MSAYAYKLKFVFFKNCISCTIVQPFCKKPYDELELPVNYRSPKIGRELWASPTHHLGTTGFCQYTNLHFKPSYIFFP